jgi:FtsP/CotA-like multicopper oxidase with cupredoxin domain
MLVSLLVVPLVARPAEAHVQIPGLTGTEFDLTARSGYIAGGDGLSIYFWGLAPAGGGVQYPAPTLILDEDVTVTVRLKNELAEGVPVSLVFPGQAGVVASGGNPGVLTQEAPPDGTTVVTYTFTPTEPGTYQYHSGTRPDLQTEMGIVGAIIVRPTGFDPMMGMAYHHHDSMYDHENLFLFTEMDLFIHQLVEFGLMSWVDTTNRRPVYWFINGRNAPDTMLMETCWLPTQPYNCLPRMHPGERHLLRIITAGRDVHPFHTHGNNMTVIATDGRLLSSGPGAGADLAYSDFTVTAVPGQTMDAIFTWNGAGLGWDIYGHDPNDPLEPGEYAADHGKPFPVVLPSDQEVTRGAAWPGSPFLGAMGAIPPGEGGMNMNGGYFYMWHSHAEYEMVNNDIFPGGLMTMLIIEPPGVPIH